MGFLKLSFLALLASPLCQAAHTDKAFGHKNGTQHGSHQEKDHKHQQTGHWTHDWTHSGIHHGQFDETKKQEPDQLCPSTCLDVMQGYRYQQVEAIQTTDIVDAVPLVPGDSHMFVYQNPYQCSLDLFVVHESEDSTSGGGQALMKFEGIDMTNATLKSGDSTSSRILYDPDNRETDVFWEWKERGDGMATEWMKSPTPGECFEVSAAKFIKGLDYWRFVAGPLQADGKADGPNNQMYLDKDMPVVVCVGTCGDVPGEGLAQKPSPSSSNGKKLVVFAGPHETGSHHIADFLKDGARPGEAMDGWIWPTVDINGKTRERPFAHYIDNLQDDTVRTDVLEGIYNAWNQSEYGVVIGTAEFDKVGENPYSGSNAVEAIYDLVKYLEIDASDVIVALTYRTPRSSHWGAVQKRSAFDTYKEFMCDEDQSRKRWEWLDTATNPFKLSIAYADMGWNVEVVDYEGTKTMGSDVAHTIACNIMSHVDCEGGQVKGLQNVTMPVLNDNAIPALAESDQKDLEDMFLSRDCYFKYLLQERPNFNVVNQRKTWNSCSAQHFELYHTFADTDFLTNAMKSQLSCSNEPLDVHDVLTSKMIPKQNSLVLLAGPRETGDAEIARFFADQTSGSFLHDPSPSFEGWSWPKPSSVFLHQKSSYDVYDLLVSYADDSVVQNLLLDTLRDSWNEESKGIIIGSSNFERVGHNPMSEYDPLRALKHVVDELRVPLEDVTVVLNYRSPRIYQWNDLFHKHFSATSYKDFLCSEDEFEKRWEFLDTVMNPMRVALGYRSEGYKVTVVDEAGVLENRKDIAHSISCNVMDGVDCTDDWISGLKDEKVEFFVSDALPDDLYDSDWAILENYFAARDCYYMYDFMQDERFSVLYQKELWKNCQQPGSIVDYAQMQYSDLVDTNFFLELLRSQVGCSTTPASDMSGMWAGNNDGIAEASKSTSNSNINTIIIIVTASLLGVLVFIVGTFCFLRRRGRARRTKTLHEYPSEGVFVNDPKTEEVIENFRNGTAYMEDEEVPPRPTTPSSTPPASAFQQNVSSHSEMQDGLGDQPKKSFESVEMDDEKSSRSNSPVLTFV